ncbi:2-keto-3-deoxygluconate permease [Aerococcaceae bacterium WGS1372]
MLNAIKRVPAGTFLVPMLVSAILYTFWPDLFQIGGLTNHIFGGAGTNGIVGAIVFCSGTGVDLKSITTTLKRHGVLLLLKFIVSVALSLLFLKFFGHTGILGVSGLAFVIVICSLNPAVYLSLMQQYGTTLDAAMYGITGLFSIPAVPMIVYGIASGGGIDWMPIISTLIPMAAGITFGNIDPDFKGFFLPALPALTFLMGWNLGYGMNLIEAFKAGGGGIVVTIVFYIVSVIYFIVDRNILKNDGTVGASYMTVAGLSVSTAAIIGGIYPETLGQYVVPAASQVMMAMAITSVITPPIVAKVSSKNK